MQAKKIVKEKCVIKFFGLKYYINIFLLFSALLNQNQKNQSTALLLKLDFSFTLFAPYYYNFNLFNIDLLI